MIVFAVILSFFAGFDCVQSEKCITPNSTEGNCIPLQQCEKISKVIDMQMINPDIDTLNYLIHSQCGFNATDVNVCCPIENANATVVTEDNYLRKIYNPHETRFKWSTKIDKKQCGLQKNVDGIDEGIIATAYDHPWLSLIKLKNDTHEEIICGGVLVSSNHVLTAANCVRGDFGERKNLTFSVLLGEYNIKSKNECSEPSATCAPPSFFVEVDEIILHPDYLSKNGSPNLALLRLKKSADLSDFVYPICLPDEGGLEYNEDFMYVAGWDQKEGQMNAIKMQSYVPIVKCPSSLTDEENDLDDSYICTGSNYLTFYRSDFGGPLITFNKNEGNATGFVMAVLNSEQNVKGENTVSYTKITPHLNWLKSTIL